MVENGSRAFAVQIEIAVVGEVAYGVGVADRGVIDCKGVVFIKGVSNGYIEVSGEALLAVRRMIGKNQRFAVDARVPQTLVKAHWSAVKVISAVIFGKTVNVSANAELCVFDSVAMSAYKRTDVLVLSFIVGGTVVSQSNVFQSSGLVGDVDGADSSAKVGYLNICSA